MSYLHIFISANSCFIYANSISSFLIESITDFWSYTDINFWPVPDPAEMMGAILFSLLPVPVPVRYGGSVLIISIWSLGWAKSKFGKGVAVDLVSRSDILWVLCESDLGRGSTIGARHWIDLWPSLLHTKHSTALRHCSAVWPQLLHLKQMGSEEEDDLRSSLIYNCTKSDWTGRSGIPVDSIIVQKFRFSLLWGLVATWTWFETQVSFS